MFTARRYATAVYAVTLCLSMRNFLGEILIGSPENTGACGLFKLAIYFGRNNRQ